MNEQKTLEKAISLLREWLYELAPLDDPKSVDVFAISKDFNRMSNNTIYFLETECKLNNIIQCPCGCNNGKSFNNSTGSEKSCTVCDGTGKLTITKAKEINLEYLFRNIK